jgi:predicted aspartyl protease
MSGFTDLLLPLVLAAGVFVQPAVQSVPKPNPQASSPEADLLTFANHDERMTVPVTISGAGPYGFIVDTGAQRTVISRELAGTLGLEQGPRVTVTAMAGTADVGTVVIPMIRVSTLGGERIEAPALESRNLGAPGLLGIDTLQGHAVTIDFVRQTMTVTPAAKKAHFEHSSPDEIIVHAKNLFGQLVVTDAYYRGRRIQVILDTGSIVSLGNLALRDMVAHSSRDMQPISLLSVTGGILKADYTQVRQISVGGVALNNLPVAFANAVPFKRFNLVTQPALLLGMDALKMFKRVQIDFPNRVVRLSLPPDAVHD